ncbi:MAG: hypothetical protein WAS25_12275 [Geothrix sp.]|uniref:hypothetical protein n=1 Tax=Geothrix sp. TaxID=1962974 RepID=UPI003BAEFAB2
MTTFEVPQIPTNPTNDPRPQNPGQERQIGDTPNPREVTASKKVDDLSRHDSKHSLDPKQDPKHNPREKVTEAPKPGCCDPAPGAPKK